MSNIKKPILGTCVFAGNLSGDSITSRDGLLWKNEKYILLPEADIIARKNGFMYAEQFVRYLEKQNEIQNF